MSKKWIRTIRKSLAWMLVLAMVSGVALNDSAVLTAKAEESDGVSETAEIAIVDSAGYEEGAYVEWAPVEGADGYQVYVSADQSADSAAWTQLDDELIRNYGSYLRADALGLTAGTWYLKVEAATFNSAREKLATLAEKVVEVTVKAHDRSGFAWMNGTSSGAYNEDGSLKENAQVLYVTEATKDKVSMTVEGAAANPCVGLQNIFWAYKLGQETTPLVVRFIGTVTDPATMESGDLVLENGKNGTGGITIEGVGEDATLVGFGIRLKNASNVEIRNLGFMLCDSVENDNVSVQQEDDHIWVHHCDFFYGMPGSDEDQVKGDGMLDCKMSNYVTFSYNHFWDSGKSCLLGLEGETDEMYISYHHNWFDHSDSRHPRVRSYSAHVYNNYYDGIAKYGVGAANAASVFVENNYFRHCKRPMLISMQGSDASGTLSGEDGGMIKAYGNVMVDCEIVAYAADSTVSSGDVSSGDVSSGDATSTAASSGVSAASSFDAYVASERTEQVPETVVTLQGGNSYNNFDTVKANYISAGNYKLDEAADVPTVVTAGAGRLNGGDFTFDFDDATDDASSVVNENLKAQLSAYTSSLVSVGGILNASEKSYCTVTFDPANGQETSQVQVELNQPVEKPADPTVIPEGKVQFDGWYNGETKWDFEDAVTGDMTLTAHYLTEDEVIYHGGTDIGTETVCHNFVESGLSSKYFAIDGNLYTKNGTSADYNNEGSVTGHGLEMANSTITFTTTTPKATLVLVMRVASTDSAKVDGVVKTAENGIIETVLDAGEHTIAGSGTSYLFKIYVIPSTGDSYTITVDKADGSEAETVTVPAGGMLTSENLPTPSREGYTFTGWVDSSNKEIYLPYEPVKDMTVTATWLKDASGTGSGGDKDQLYNMKLVVSDLPANTYAEPVSKNGITVLADSSNTVVVDSSNKTIDGVAYTARLKTGGAGTKDYKSITFTTKAVATLSIACLASSTNAINNMGVATLDADGNFVDYTGEVTTDGVTVTCTDGNIPVTGTNPGRYITLELPEANTYYVYSKGGGINFYGIYVTYAGGVDPVTCTVSFNAMGGLSVDAQQVQTGETCVEPAATLRTGYTFAGWYTDYDCTKAYDFSSIVNGDMMLFAKWTEGEVGTNLVLDMKDLPTRSYTEPFDKNGFSFSASTEKGLSVDNSTVTINGIDYTKRLKLNGSGSTSSRNVSFTVSEESTLTIVAESGSAGTPRTLVVTDGSVNHNIDSVDAAAKYTQDLEPGTWSIYSGDSGMNIFFIAVLPKGESVAVCVITVDKADGTEATSLTVNAGVPVTETELPTPTREGYVFTGWVDGGNNPVNVPFVPTANMTLTATWKEGSDDPNPQPPVPGEGLKVELANPGEEYIYTGSAIKPAIIVTNNGEELTEGVDYTVKYSGNTKVSTEKSKAKITVTGKGNLSGSASTTFDIQPKDIADADVTVGDIVIATGTKPVPVLLYNNVKLTTKDYTLSTRGEDGKLTAVGKFTENGELVITGKGNYTGEITVDVTVKAKSELKKFTVTLGKEKLTYNGEEQKISFTVNDSKDKKKETNLTEGTDYIVVYPENITDAGTVKFTVVGMGEYTGSVTKSYSIKPLVAAAGSMTASGVNADGYEYRSTGVTVGEDLVVTYNTEAGDVILTAGKDYKITYSNNKKVSTDKSQAKYTVTFLGNYKGTKAVSGTFKVTAASLSGAEVVAADKVYTGKANTYASKPYVTIDGVALKTSDYTVKYYKDASMTDEITSKNKLSLADDASEATVYVKVTGKGNYAGENSEATGEYKVRRTSKEAGKEIYDLSKAKVTVVDANGKKLSKVEYTGEALEPAVKVEYKIGKTWVTLEKDVDYEVTYVNNVNKGKATVMITGSGEKYVGSKTAAFSVVAKNLKGVSGLLDQLFSALGL